MKSAIAFLGPSESLYEWWLVCDGPIFHCQVNHNNALYWKKKMQNFKFMKFFIYKVFLLVTLKICTEEFLQIKLQVENFLSV